MIGRIAKDGLARRPSCQQRRQTADGVLCFGDHLVHDRRGGKDLANQADALAGIVCHERGLAFGMDSRWRAGEHQR